MMLLSAANLSKSFGAITAVQRFGMDLEPGAIYGIIGPNGAGKTSLFSILTGFLPADAGSVQLNGREVLGLKAFELARLGIARSFQLVKPFLGMTMLETIEIPIWGCRSRHRRKSLAQAREDAVGLLARLRLMDKSSMLVDELNQGELRLLDIVRALAADPDIIFLDEPFAGLCTEEIELLSGIFVEQRAAGKTVVIIEHRLRELMSLVDHVTVMNFGAKLAEGAPKEVVRNEAVIDAYIGKAGEGLNDS